MAPAAAYRRGLGPVKDSSGSLAHRLPSLFLTASDPREGCSRATAALGGASPLTERPAGQRGPAGIGGMRGTFVKGTGMLVSLCLIAAATAALLFLAAVSASAAT